MKTNTLRKPDKAYIVEKLRLLLPLLLFAVVYMIWWSRLEQVTRARFTVIHTRVDDLIPFLEVFIIPYYLWFGYVAFTVAAVLLKGTKQEYLRTVLFLTSGMLLFLIVSTVFPNRLTLRPHVMPRDNVFTALVAALYRVDTPTNVFPSIHVYNAIGAYLAVRDSRFFSKTAERCAGVLSILIILSTMFLKQHSTYDVAGAVALAVVMNYLVYHTEWIARLSARKETAEGLRFRLRG